MKIHIKEIISALNIDTKSLICIINYLKENNKIKKSNHHYFDEQEVELIIQEWHKQIKFSNIIFMDFLLKSNYPNMEIMYSDINNINDVMDNIMVLQKCLLNYN